MSNNKLFSPNRSILVYIASDVRSGSTLLDMVLGGHPNILSIGELQFLKDHFQRKGTGYSWDWRCTCGEYFDTCPFWSKIDHRITIDTGLPIRSLETWVKRSAQFFPLMVLPNKRLGNYRSSYPSIQRGLDAAQNCWKIVDLLHMVTGKEIIVDSSKIAEQFRFLYVWRPKRIRMSYLLRDGRGVIYSKMHREGDSARKASKTWVLENLKILLIKALIPKKKSIMVKYEDLCQNSQLEINRITSFLNIPPVKVRLSKSDRHNVCGSPHRFNKDDTNIRLDERWRSKLHSREKNIFNVVGGWLNFFLGYR